MKGNNDEEDYIDDAFDDDEDKNEGFTNNNRTSAANVVGNGQIQNELVDKEVEQVIMKSSTNNEASKAKGGYAIPGDSDENEDNDDGIMDDDQDEDNLNNKVGNAVAHHSEDLDFEASKPDLSQIIRSLDTPPPSS